MDQEVSLPGTLKRNICVTFEAFFWKNPKHHLKMVIIRIFCKLNAKMMLGIQYSCTFKVLRVEKILKPGRALKQ